MKVVPQFSLVFAVLAIAFSSCSLTKNVTNTASASYQRLMLVQQTALQKHSPFSPAYGGWGLSQGVPPIWRGNLQSPPFSIAPKHWRFYRNIIKKALNHNAITQVDINKTKSVSIHKTNAKVKNAYVPDNRRANALSALEIFLTGIAFSIIGLAIYFANYIYPTSGASASLLAYSSISLQGLTFQWLFALFGEILYIFGFFLFLLGGARLIKRIVTNKHDEFQNIPFINSFLALLLGIVLIAAGLALVIKNYLAYGLVIYGLYMLGILFIGLGIYALWLGIATIVGASKEKKREKELPNLY